MTEPLKNSIRNLVTRAYETGKQEGRKEVVESSIPVGEDKTSCIPLFVPVTKLKNWGILE